MEHDLTTVRLYKPLNISTEDFIRNYNLDISEYVERHTARERNQSKNGTPVEILYLSYTHAIRLMRLYHPGIEADWVPNPETGGPLWKDLDGLTYFVKVFLHDGERRSSVLYYPALSMSGQGVHPNDLKLDKSGNVKVTASGDPVKVVDSQFVNKLVARAIAKAIAMVLGFGLKLWTGDDLSEIMDEKMSMLIKIIEMADEFEKKTGKVFDGFMEVSYTSSTAEIKKVGTRLKQALLELNNHE